MTASRAEAGAARVSPLRRGRLFGFLLVAVLAGICAMPCVPGLDTLRLSWFDVCQRAAPRARVSGPVVIVDVDGRSLAPHGQWPWPRTLLARSFDRIAAGEPGRHRPRRRDAGAGSAVAAAPARADPHHRPRPRGAARRAAEQRRGAGRGDPRTPGRAGASPAWIVSPSPASQPPGRMAPVRSVGGDPMPRSSGATTRCCGRVTDDRPRGGRLRPAQRRSRGRRRAPDPAGRAGRRRA